MDMTTASLTLGPRAPLFRAIWVVMMVAMMFPTATPAKRLLMTQSGHARITNQCPLLE
jgi:predicted metal-binding membrane protein